MRMPASLALVAALAVSALMPSQADASLVLYAQQAGVNGGAITQIATGADFTNAIYNANYGTFTLTLTGAASSNEADLSSLLTAAVRVRNNSTSTQTISIYASQNNYTLPAGTPLNVESALGGSVNEGDFSGSGVFQAYADSGNNLLGLSDFTNGPQNAIFNGSSFDTGSATGVFNRTGLYSLTSVFTATVSAGGSGNFSSHVNVTPNAVVPEPATLAMAFAGLPLIGLVALRRSRKAQG